MSEVTQTLRDQAKWLMMTGDSDDAQLAAELSALASIMEGLSPEQ